MKEENKVECNSMMNLVFNDLTWIMLDSRN